MIMLTKLNGKEILVNSDQIQTVESIPESKILFNNGEYLLVRNGAAEIIDKIVEFRRKYSSIDADVLKEILIMSAEAEGENN